MSRTYKWFFSCYGLKKSEAEVVRDEVEDFRSYLSVNLVEWRKVGGEIVEYALQGEGEWNIGGGQSEEDEARRIRHAAWRAAGRFVDVAVGAIFVEDPDEWHRGTEAEFKEFYDDLDKCERCGKPSDDPLCEACNDEGMDADASTWCQSCKVWFDAKDPDDRLCPACQIDAAEHRMEER